MPQTPLQSRRELVIVSDDWERMVNYLEEISLSLADARTEMPGPHDSLEARRMMASYLDNEIDTIKRLRHNGDAKPTKRVIDNPG